MGGGQSSTPSAGIILDIRRRRVVLDVDPTSRRETSVPMCCVCTDEG